jgi:hypothetical protein
LLSFFLADSEFWRRQIKKVSVCRRRIIVIQKSLHFDERFGRAGADCLAFLGEFEAFLLAVAVLFIELK